MPHTPGPWRSYNSHRNRTLKNWRVIAANNEPICIVEHAICTLDNVNLITEAPNLLAVCKEALSKLESVHITWNLICDVRNNLAAAIARAKGESNA
jgi:hypothetical protein